MKYKAVLNYLGQLRIYSFLDLVILATALTRNTNTLFGISLLWLSFLLYLESRHKNEPRLPINDYLWLVPFILALILLPIWICSAFALLSYLYTKKKQGKIWGATAPFWRGLQNGVIVIGFNPQLAVIVFVIYFVRNLVGDFRDAFADRQRGIETIPVLLGINKNQVWAFYTHILFVMATTIIWFNYSFLDARFILPIIILQLISYPLTPRLSNPKYLNIYGNAR